MNDLVIRKIYFSCFRGNLSFLDFHNISTGKGQTYMFCGKYPPFTIYLGRNVDIQFQYFRAQIGVKFDLNYSVITSHIIKHAKCSNCSTFLTSSIHVKKYNFTLYTYHIHIQKYKQLCLNFSVYDPEKMFIFDGPGHHKSLQRQIVILSTFCVSSFQCLAQVEKTAGYSDVITYAARNVSTKEIIVVSENTMQLIFPPANCGNILVQFCLLKFSATKVINVTMLDFIFEGTITSSCRYGGIAFYKVCRTQYPVQPAVCTNESGSAWWRSKYFNTGAMCIVMYSYHEYSKISAHFTVATTQCKSVLLDMCKYIFHCVKEAHLPNSKECNSFLKMLNNQAAIQFMSKKHGERLWYSGWSPHLIYQQPPKSCVVLQVATSKSELDKEMLHNCIEQCAIRSMNTAGQAILVPTLQPYKGLTHHVKIVGEIWPNWFQDEKVLTFELSKGASVKLMLNIKKAEFGRRLKNPRNVHFFEAITNEENKKVYFAVLFHTPFLNIIPKIILGNLIKSSLSWMDIQIHYSKDDGCCAPHQMLHMDRRKHSLSTSLIENTVLAIVLSRRDRLRCLLKSRKTQFIFATFKLTLKSKEFLPFLVKTAIEFESYGYTLSGKFNAKAGLTCSGPIYFLSVPGLAEYVDIELHATNMTENAQAYWTNGNVKYGSKFSCQADGMCGNQKSVHYLFNDAVKHQYFSKGVYNIFSTHSNMPFVDVNPDIENFLYDFDFEGDFRQEMSLNEPSFHSWSSALSACDKMSGHFPVFADSSDVEELVTMLKVRDDLRWMRAVFIGLKVNKGCCVQLCSLWHEVSVRSLVI